MGAKQIDRRTWLVRMASGAVALWSEVKVGRGRSGWSIALGGPGLATRVAEAEPLAATQALRVPMGFVNAYALVRGKEVALVDTGTPNNGERFAEVVRTAGLGWDAVRHVILTHYHGDHVGSTDEILTAAPKAVVYAGAPDIPQIKVTRTTIKAVADGEEVFGLRIILTPGHTPGHICVYDPTGSLLVAGDALVNVNERLTGSNPQYTTDMAQANQSVKKLAAVRFERAVFGHGEPIDNGAGAAVAKLASTL